MKIVFTDLVAHCTFFTMKRLFRGHTHFLNVLPCLIYKALKILEGDWNNHLFNFLFYAIYKFSYIQHL